eukprot:9413787-Alexandrium_andersonii.AAC.1
MLVLRPGTCIGSTVALVSSLGCSFLCLGPTCKETCRGTPTQACTHNKMQDNWKAMRLQRTRLEKQHVPSAESGHSLRETFTPALPALSGMLCMKPS